jgi:signal transduction histidine kinase
MGRLIRQHDWSTTPLGPVERWPQALRGALGICLQSSFPTAIYWGPDLRLLYNDAWALIPAEKHPWALGKPAREVWPDIWHVLESQFRDVWVNARGISNFDQMLPMRRRDQTEETYWNYSLTPILDEHGEVAGIFNQGNETTEKVLAARKHRAEIDRLREWFQQAPGAVTVLSGPQHICEVANAAYLQLVGNRPIIGKPVAEALPEIVEQGFVRILDDVFRSGVAYTGESTPIRLQRAPCAEPEERLLDFVYQPIKNAAGKVSGIFVQATDVTERARTEAALRRSEAVLRDADRRKDEFLATLAHELRNPLAPIVSATRMIQIEGSADAALKKAADIVERQVRHMVRLVDDLLDVSRITHGRIELRVEPVTLDSIIAHAVEAAEPLIAEKRHELAVKLPAENVLVHGDLVRLSQAVLNLVNNAARYTPPNGRIVIDAALDGDRVRIGVADNGVGMREESLETIFELFTQGDGSAEHGFSGLGIGLHLARELVALHGGELTAHSDGLGKGSTFVITLPVNAHAHAGARRGRPASIGMA